MQAFKRAIRDHARPRKQRPRILSARQQNHRIVDRRFEAQVQIFVAGDVTNPRVIVAQFAQQREQRFDLRSAVRHSKRLMPTVAPIRITSNIRQLNADRSRVVTDRMICDARIGDVTINAAIDIDVIMPAVTGAAA